MALSLKTAPAALGAETQPMPLPLSPPIAVPEDKPYPGVLALFVDATDLRHGVFAVHEVIPVTAGPLVLQFPKWLPGHHNPSGEVERVAGLFLHAGDQRIDWKRDPVEPSAFHVVVPEGVKTLDVDFQFLSATSARDGRVVKTPQMLNAQFTSLSFYPAGYFIRDIQVKASIKLPDGWKYATALETEREEGPWAHFKTTSYNTLTDSPLVAGRYFKRFDLDPGGPAPVHLDVVADRPDELEATPVQIQAHKSLVQQAYKVFGSHHYQHYDFLFSLSDKMGGIGLEHHQSSEDGTSPKYFTDWEHGSSLRDILAHEFTHSWNGKFRRGADLWTPTLNVPMRDSLLWVYEGQTQYWGYVLAARSGLMSKQDALDAIASTAAAFNQRVGRTWRTLEDTTNAPLLLGGHGPPPMMAWLRRSDYYSEGELIWLDADTLIREKTDGRKSLDDFATAFFGVENGSFVTKTYTFDDVVAALYGVVPYDWAGFLNKRLEGHGPGAPLDGVKRGGYKLVFDETQSLYLKSDETRRKETDLMFGIGLSINSDGRLTDVQWDGPAFNAGLSAGQEILAVNSETFSTEALKRAITAAKTFGSPIVLGIKAMEEVRTVDIAYTGGLRYPHFERDTSIPARLDEILAPRP